MRTGIVFLAVFMLIHHEVTLGLGYISLLTTMYSAKKGKCIIKQVHHTGYALLYHSDMDSRVNIDIINNSINTLLVLIDFCPV